MTKKKERSSIHGALGSSLVMALYRFCCGKLVMNSTREAVLEPPATSHLPAPWPRFPWIATLKKVDWLSSSSH